MNWFSSNSSIFMILHGHEVLERCAVSRHIKIIAEQVLARGPVPWSKDQID